MLNRRRSDRAANASPDTSLIARGTVIRGDLRFSGALPRALSGEVLRSIESRDTPMAAPTGGAPRRSRARDP